MLLESFEEFSRVGNNFERIYPVKSTIDYYLNFFEIQRYNNILLSKIMKCDVDLIGKVFEYNSWILSLFNGNFRIAY